MTDTRRRSLERSASLSGDPGDAARVKVAALYVLPDGPYAGREDVDLWDEKRDARLYAGPKCGHASEPSGCSSTPPHRRTASSADAKQSPSSPTRPCMGANRHHRSHGGCATTGYGLVEPKHGAGWVRGLFDAGWTCSVEQGNYGHRARKRTWLYFVGAAAPADLDWSGAVVAPCPWRGGWVEFMGKRERKLTPVPFAEALLSLARSTRAEAA